MRSKPLGARLPQARVPGRPPLHRGTKALILPNTLSQLASEIYLFLVLRTELAPVSSLAQPQTCLLQLHPAEELLPLSNGLNIIPAYRNVRNSGIDLAFACPSKFSLPSHLALLLSPFPSSPILFKVLAGLNIIFMVSQAWNQNRRCVILHHT